MVTIAIFLLLEFAFSTKTLVPMLRSKSVFTAVVTWSTVVSSLTSRSSTVALGFTQHAWRQDRVLLNALTLGPLSEGMALKRTRPSTTAGIFPFEGLIRMDSDRSLLLFSSGKEPYPCPWHRFRADTLPLPSKVFRLPVSTPCEKWASSSFFLLPS